MRRLGMAGVCAVGLALGLGCGPAGSLPNGQGPVVEPEVPAGEDPALSAGSLWPLTTGSRWRYRIDDPVRGVFVKEVVVLGEAQVPGTTASAIQVSSVQDHISELSWQVLSGGVAFRVREEDRKLGYLVRVMTWNPAVMKSLAEPQPLGWTRQETVREVERDANGTLVKEREKLFEWVLEAVEPLTTEAGHFEEAYRIRRQRSDKDDWERVYWLVKGVGKVREEGPRTEELIDYEIR